MESHKKQKFLQKLTLAPRKAVVMNCLDNIFVVYAEEQVLQRTEQNQLEQTFLAKPVN